MVNGLQNPFTYSAPNINMPGMFSGALSQVRGGGYPGGPSFGIAPQTAMAQQGMQNALFGQQTANQGMKYNLGMSGLAQQYNMMFNPTPFDYLAGLFSLGQAAPGISQNVNDILGKNQPIGAPMPMSLM